MGVQVYFDKVAALKAGAIFTTYYDDETDVIVESYSVPEIKNKKFLNHCGDEFGTELSKKVCTDFNDWGVNKKFLEPWLKIHNIDFYVA